MARRRRKTRSYKAPTRRRRARRSTRKGGVRRTARRAYRRRNPKSPFGTPAVRFGIAATVGAGAGLAINNRTDLGKNPALMAAAAVLLISQFLLKGRNRQFGYAAGIGMLLPLGATAIGDAVNAVIPAGGFALGNGNGNGNGTSTSGRIAARSAVRFPRAMIPQSKRRAVVATTSRMKAV